MFRIVLATYTLLLALAGPAPCCCSLSRLMTMATTCVGSASADRATWNDCCASGLVDSEDQSDDSSDEKSPNPKHRCPCMKSTTCPVPPRTAIVAGECASDWLDFFLPAHTSEFVAPCGNEFDRPRFNDSPPALTGRGRRIVLCSWRC